jgi:hypothetical protein
MARQHRVALICLKRAAKARPLFESRSPSSNFARDLPPLDLGQNDTGVIASMKH